MSASTTASGSVPQRKLRNIGAGPIRQTMPSAKAQPLRRRGLYLRFVPSVCTFGLYLRFVPSVCTFGLYLRFVPSVCTFGLYLRFVPSVCTFGLYLRFVPSVSKIS